MALDGLGEEAFRGCLLGVREEEGGRVRVRVGVRVREGLGEGRGDGE